MYEKTIVNLSFLRCWSATMLPTMGALDWPTPAFPLGICYIPDALESSEASETERKSRESQAVHHQYMVFDKTTSLWVEDILVEGPTGSIPAESLPGLNCAYKLRKRSLYVRTSFHRFFTISSFIIARRVFAMARKDVWPNFLLFHVQD